MKNIKVAREIKKQLMEFGDGKSINKTMRQLLQDVEPSETYIDGMININMDDDLWEKLCDCRVYPSESFSSVIYRLLQSNQD